MTWREVEPFPNNAIYPKRLEAMGEYEAALVGSPIIFDNSAGAFSEYPSHTSFNGDANHRQERARMDGKLDEEFIAVIHRGLTREEMYRIRRGLGNRRTVKPAETFLSRAEEGYRQERRIKETVEALGWAITHERANGSLSCTNELEWIWERERGAVVLAIQTYEEAFGRKVERPQARVIKGLGCFWMRYPKADRDRLVKSLRGVSVDDLYVSGKGQRQTNYTIKSVHDGIRYMLALGYNKGQRKGQLPL